MDEEEEVEHKEEGTEVEKVWRWMLKGWKICASF
jgi:hypothetical protein